ncbi:MAG: hypothetical protein [Microviridae sp.]|nr:MAG: hypothetical protein [Microviridae sp.]
MKHQLIKTENYPGQIFTQPSQTVPDQTMSIRTILEKYARGENFNQRTPIFSEDDGENMGLDIRRMDLSEIAELKKHNEDEIKRLQEKVGNKRAEKAIQQREEAIQLAAKRLMAEDAERRKNTTETTNSI